MKTAIEIIKLIALIIRLCLVLVLGIPFYLSVPVFRILGIKKPWTEMANLFNYLAFNYKP